MEKIIPLVTVLFVLSMICERIAEFLKHFLSGKKILGYYIVGNTSTKYPEGSKEEQRRFYRILKINLVCGFITALLCHASLFTLLKNLDNPAFGWPEKKISIEFSLGYFIDHFPFLLGCFLTGAFISMGSKFWHDLLDILMAVKDAKNTVTRMNQEDRFERLTEPEKFQLLDAAINENSDDWRNSFKGYRGVSIGNKYVGPENVSTNRLSLRFNVEEKVEMNADSKGIVPEFIFYHGYKLPTDVVPAGTAEANVDTIPENEMPRPLGSSVARDSTGDTGTLGVKAEVKINGQKKLCGVSCYHVLFPEELYKRNFEIFSGSDGNISGNTAIYSPGEKRSAVRNNIGSIEAGKFNPYVDIGLFETKDSDLSAAVFGFGKIKDVYVPALSDQDSLKVKFFGRTSLEQKGTLVSIKCKQDILYFGQTARPLVHELKNLIQIRIKSGKGDSGAAVLTTDNKLIGILAASDAQFAYVIPVESINANFSIKYKF